MDGKIIAIGLAITFGLIYVRVFENEFFKDIIQIAIPSVIGLFTTKWISTSWQRRKETNEIKKKIIDEYTQSFGNEYTMLGEFAGMLYNKYFDHSIHRETSEHGIQFRYNFPTEESKMPSVVYKEEWEEFDKKIWKNTYLKNEFFSNFRLYYEDEKLSADILKVNEMLLLCYQRIDVFVHLKNPEEFQQTQEKIQSELDDILTNSMNIEAKLIKNEIKIK